MSRATRIAAEPRAGLSTGDVIAFTTVDDGHPYVVSRAADEDGRDDDGVFLFAPDASLLPASASEAKRHDALRGAADAHLEVQRRCFTNCSSWGRGGRIFNLRTGAHTTSLY